MELEIIHFKLLVLRCLPEVNRKGVALRGDTNQYKHVPSDHAYSPILLVQPLQSGLVSKKQPAFVAPAQLGPNLRYTKNTIFSFCSQLACPSM